MANFSLQLFAADPYVSTYGLIDFTIKSADGNTTLFNSYSSFGSYDLGDLTITVTSTGVTIYSASTGTTQTYTYSGSNTFVGLASSPNSASATYDSGDSFTASHNGGYIYYYRYYIVEETVSNISIDLTTLSGWSNLTTGTHAITVKAKASGYLDSNASNSVNVTKAASGYTINIEGLFSTRGTYYYKIDGTASSTEYDGTISSYSTITGVQSYISICYVSSSGFSYYSSSDVSSISYYYSGSYQCGTITITGDNPTFALNGNDPL